MLLLLLRLDFREVKRFSHHLLVDRNDIGAGRLKVGGGIIRLGYEHL